MRLEVKLFMSLEISFEGQLYQHNQPVCRPVEWLKDMFLNHGVDFFKELDGEFLIAIHHNNDFFLIRDPLGQHPVYFRKDNAETYSSTYLKIKKSSDTINPDGVEISYRKHKQRYHDIYPTHFNEILSLGPGFYLHKNKNNLCINQYWNPLSTKIKNIGFKEHLINSVKKRLSRQNSSAFFVSGGLDSSVIYSIANSYSNNLMNLHYYSELFKKSDERFMHSELSKNSNTHQILMDNFKIQNEDFNDYVQRSESFVFDPFFKVQKHCFNICQKAQVKDVFWGHWGDQVLFPINLYSELILSGSVFNGIKKTCKLAKSYEPGSRKQIFFQIIKGAIKNRTRNSYYEDLVYNPYYLQSRELNFKLAKSFQLKFHYPYLDRHLIEFMSQSPIHDILLCGEWKALLKHHFNDFVPNKVLARHDKGDYSEAASHLCSKVVPSSNSSFKNMNEDWAYLDKRCHAAWVDNYK